MTHRRATDAALRGLASAAAAVALGGLAAPPPGLAADSDGDGFDDDGRFGPRQPIAVMAMGPTSAAAADLDGDGDLDVLTTSFADDTTAWYENLDGAGSFGSRQTITTATDGPSYVVAGDLDGDDDLDVVTASSNDSTIAWHENTDGLGSFGPRQVISTLAVLATTVRVADLDGDDDLDVLSSSWGDDKIAWYENEDGLGGFGPQRVISTSAVSATRVAAADLDGDTDLDVLSSSYIDNEIAWYENTDGQGTFGSGQTITSTALGAIGVAAANLDGDGDLDVIGASHEVPKVAWNENTGAGGSFGPERPVSIPYEGPFAALPADLDGDGDSDLIVASGPDDTIGWLENLDGLGSFGLAQPIVTDATSARSGEGVDLDGDGDLDVLTVVHFDHSVEWHENLGPADNCPGVPNPDQADSDGDGIGNACDTSIPALPAAWLPVAFLALLAATVRRGASAPPRRSPERASAGH